MFTHDNIMEDLNGNLSHHLENILLMNISAHWFFDELYLWLKPVGVHLSSLSLGVSSYPSAGCTTHLSCVCGSGVAEVWYKSTLS